ncbi:MAG: phosphatidyl-myo-inositol alpha-mannosyltransferase [Nocardioidaceae bacterium]|nr:phosphatidyl-myo-inositol alpha-mannosyltransferase [Nocardioidaceae bacterium]
MRPLRIGLVCPYSLDVPGGVQNHVRDLAAVLHDRGHEVAVLAPGERSDELPDYVTSAGRAVPVRWNGSVARVAFGPRAVARVRRWLAEGKFDVLHVHEPSSPSVSLIALWASDVPVVGTFHSATPRSRAMSSTASLLRPSMEKITARIAVSEAARATLVQHVGGEPVVIPNGVWCAPFAEATPREEWMSPGPTIAFLGRTEEPRKGLAVLMAALPAVLARHPTTRLLVAGRGRAEAWSDQPEEVLSRVEFLGQVTDVDRARLLSSATVYVAPQIGGESFGVVLVEAMAAGAAVAASALPAFRAVLGGGELGELFAVGDPLDLARAVGSLLDDPQRRTSMRERAAVAVKRYDWSELVGDIEAVYSAVVAVAPGGR